MRGRDSDSTPILGGIYWVSYESVCIVAVVQKGQRKDCSEGGLKEKNCLRGCSKQGETKGKKPKKMFEIKKTTEDQKTTQQEKAIKH